jgi:hypothetical protein
MSEPLSERDQRAAELFVRETLAAVQQSPCDRAAIALAFLEVSAGLMRQDIEEQPARFRMYAHSLMVLSDFVLDSIPGPPEACH